MNLLYYFVYPPITPVNDRAAARGPSAETRSIVPDTGREGEAGKGRFVRDTESVGKKKSRRRACSWLKEHREINAIY